MLNSTLVKQKSSDLFDKFSQLTLQQGITDQTIKSTRLPRTTPHKQPINMRLNNQQIGILWVYAATE